MPSAQLTAVIERLKKKSDAAADEYGNGVRLNLACGDIVVSLDDLNVWWENAPLDDKDTVRVLFRATLIELGNSPHAAAYYERFRPYQLFDEMQGHYALLRLMALDKSARLDDRALGVCTALSIACTKILSASTPLKVEMARRGIVVHQGGV
jgi:hypothetical protein